MYEGETLRDYGFKLGNKDKVYINSDYTKELYGPLGVKNSIKTLRTTLKKVKTTTKPYKTPLIRRGFTFCGGIKCGRF